MYKNQTETVKEQVAEQLINIKNSLFAKQEVGKPFYIIDEIKNNICTCNVFATRNSDNELSPILFLDKKLAEKTAKLFNDDRAVTGLSNYYFNVLFFKTIECLIATSMDENGDLVLVTYTIEELRAKYNLKTTEELKQISNAKH